MSVKCTSTRFGSFDVPDDRVVRFPSGLLGFPDHQRYVILDHDTETPFKWLQSVEDTDLAFVFIDPAIFHPDYHIDIPADALTEIKDEQSDALTVVVILTIPSDDPGQITANLRGPLLISHRTKLAKQLVLSGEFPTRHPLFPASPPSSGVPTDVQPTAECPA
jgi:flagellar assembly factor FliW